MQTWVVHPVKCTENDFYLSNGKIRLACYLSTTVPRRGKPRLIFSMSTIMSD